MDLELFKINIRSWYYYQLIIIQKLENKENNFEYIVVEGNTRLTIYTELNQEFSKRVTIVGTKSHVR